MRSLQEFVRGLVALWLRAPALAQAYPDVRCPGCDGESLLWICAACAAGRGLGAYLRAVCPRCAEEVIHGLAPEPCPCPERHGEHDALEDAEFGYMGLLCAACRMPICACGAAAAPCD